MKALNISTPSVCSLSTAPVFEYCPCAAAGGRRLLEEDDSAEARGVNVDMVRIY